MWRLLEMQYVNLVPNDKLTRSNMSYPNALVISRVVLMTYEVKRFLLQDYNNIFIQGKS